MRHISQASARFALAAVLAVLVGCSESKSVRPGAPPLAEVGVLQPVERVVPEWQVYTGRLEAVDRVDVRARVTGFVERVNFEEGALVARGDLLCTLDPRTFVAERDAARARVEEAEARLGLARSEAERVQGLIASRAVSREELEQRTREVDTAEASLSAARAALQSAELDLEFTRVVAPVAGRVGRELITAGNLVSGGSGSATVLTTILSINPIYFRFPIDEPAALRLRGIVDASDEPVPVELQLTGREDFEHRGRLDFLDNRIDEETGTLMVRAVFDNPGGSLVPGAFGRIRLQLDPPEPRLLVPEKALGVDQTQQILMVLGDGDVVERRVVTTGPLADGWRVIRSGVDRDDRVIVEGLLSARPGSKVSPQPLEPTP